MKIEFLACEKPSNIAVSAARTCYSAGGLVFPSQSEGWSRKESLLDSIFKAGHHTTLQHTHITMLISGMSRHLIWRLLHSHPYYNSEQVSQRYAKMKIENFVYPSGEERVVWESYYRGCFDRYEKLTLKLLPVMQRLLPKFRKKDAAKKAQEFARYLLPQGVGTYLYHTVNIITILRYIAAAKAMPEARAEAGFFANLLGENLIRLDLDLAPLVDFARKEKVDFPDLDLMALKKRLKIGNSEKVRVYDVTNGLDFTVGLNHANVLRLSSMLHDGAVLGGFSSFIKLSLSADAQNQRHRRSLCVRPALENFYERDFYIPPVIAQDEELAAFYCESIGQSYEFFEKQREQIGFGEAVYALPNAHNIEIIERNDFSSFIHKAQMRLCYNAQQEIFDIVYEQVRQLRSMGFTEASSFLPPCALRFGLGLLPICPEGERFCGIKVWKSSFEEYRRTI